MKKLLYTLFAFAIIVACEKDMDDNYDSSSINPIEASVESIDVDAASFLNSLAESVTKQEIADYEANKTTARTGASGTQWMHIVFFTFGANNIPLVYLRSDDTPEICAEAGQISVLYTLEVASSGASRIKIERTNGDGTVVPVSYSRIGASLRANYNTLFGQTIDRLSRSNTTFDGFELGRVPSVATLASRGIDFSCSSGVADEWTADANGLYTNPTYPGNSYTLAEAPFPLTGWLATMVDNTSDVTPINYAGTSTSTVNSAIQDNIEP